VTCCGNCERNKRYQRKVFHGCNLGSPSRYGFGLTDN
jgi:hypothetical protein